RKREFRFSLPLLQIKFLARDEVANLGCWLGLICNPSCHHSFHFTLPVHHDIVPSHRFGRTPHQRRLSRLSELWFKIGLASPALPGANLVCSLNADNGGTSWATTIEGE